MANEPEQNEMASQQNEMASLMRSVVRRAVPAGSTVLIGTAVDDEVHALFDRSFYTEQTGLGFADDETALLHYLMRGAQEGYDPHGLFNSAYYLDQSPAARMSGVNPLVHFLDQGAQTGVSPSPYF